jgi:hypothetical protein
MKGPYKKQSGGLPVWVFRAFYWIHCYEHFRLYQIVGGVYSQTVSKLWLVNQSWVKSVPIPRPSLDPVESSNQIKRRREISAVFLQPLFTLSHAEHAPPTDSHISTPDHAVAASSPHHVVAVASAALLALTTAAPRGTSFRPLRQDFPVSSSPPTFAGSHSSSASRPVPPLFIQAESRRLHRSFATSRRQLPNAASLV